MNYKILSALLIVTLASLACGFTVDLPKVATPGPDVTEEITVAVPESDETRLSIAFGAGELKLSPGASESLVEGTATYNIKDFKPEITETHGDVRIQQGEYELKTIPSFENVKNEWDLKLGDAPMELTIEAGAYDAEYEFGGLSLTSLTVKDGAANVDLAFSSPNKAEMSVLQYTTGASSVNLTGLANANFSTFIFSGGAGDYTLDFSGDLIRDAVVNVETGFGDMNLIIPKDVNAVVTVDSAAVDINHSSGWSQNGNEYTQEGTGPSLTIIVQMAAGILSITD